MALIEIAFYSITDVEHGQTLPASEALEKFLCYLDALVKVEKLIWFNI